MKKECFRLCAAGMIVGTIAYLTATGPARVLAMAETDDEVIATTSEIVIEITSDEPLEDVEIGVAPGEEQVAAVPTQSEIYAVARTLQGECYDDKVEDKRNVAKVICNRASIGYDGVTSIEGIVSAKGQFNGYWKHYRSMTQNDIDIATEVLTQWYQQGCTKFNEYLYFTAGSGRVNKFR